MADHQKLTVWSPIHGPESQQPIVTATEDSCLGSYENQRCCSSSNRSSFPPPPPPHSLCLSLLSLHVHYHSLLSICPVLTVLLPSSSLLCIPLSFSFHLFLQHLYPCPSPSSFTVPDCSILHTHTLTLMHACSTANIKICAGWHSAFKRRRGKHTQSHSEDGVWLVAFSGPQPIRCSGLPLDVSLSDWNSSWSLNMCKREPVLQWYTQ